MLVKQIDLSPAQKTHVSSTSAVLQKIGSGLLQYDLSMYASSASVVADDTAYSAGMNLLRPHPPSLPHSPLHSMGSSSPPCPLSLRATSCIMEGSAASPPPLPPSPCTEITPSRMKDQLSGISRPRQAWYAGAQQSWRRDGRTWGRQAGAGRARVGGCCCIGERGMAGQA